jgi:hypothetical protein
MHTHRFGRKIKLPATIAIKHQIRQLMFEEAVKNAEADPSAELLRGQRREEIRSVPLSDLPDAPTSPAVSRAIG